MVVEGTDERDRFARPQGTFHLQHTRHDRAIHAGTSRRQRQRLELMRFKGEPEQLRRRRPAEREQQERQHGDTENEAEARWRLLVTDHARSFILRRSVTATTRFTSSSGQRLVTRMLSINRVLPIFTAPANRMSRRKSTGERNVSGSTRAR